MSKVREEVDGQEYFKEIHFLYEIINSLRNTKEVKAFLKDILTRSELIMLKRRWHIAGMLYEGIDIRTVAMLTHTSTNTVNRIKRVLDEGQGGLIVALEKSKKKQKRERDNSASKSHSRGSAFVIGDEINKLIFGKE